MTPFARHAMPLVVALLLSACASKPASYVTLLRSPDGSTGTVFVKGSKGAQTLDIARYAVPLDGSKAAAPVNEATFKADFSDAMAALPQLPARFLLYFDSGGINLTAESAALLPLIIGNAAKRPAVDASIIGHTDTVGRPDTNEVLALKRAQSIAELILTQGLKVDTLSVESHGESNPLVATPDETSEPKNRRVEVSLR